MKAAIACAIAGYQASAGAPYRPFAPAPSGSAGETAFSLARVRRELRTWVTDRRPLWLRALEERGSMHMRRTAPRDGKRHYPRARLGDRFGRRVVIKLLPPASDYQEMVRVRCACGREADANVSNLRKTLSCVHCSAARRTK